MVRELATGQVWVAQSDYIPHQKTLREGHVRPSSLSPAADLGRELQLLSQPAPHLSMVPAEQQLERVGICFG